MEVCATPSHLDGKTSGLPILNVLNREAGEIFSDQENRTQLPFFRGELWKLHWQGPCQRCNYGLTGKEADCSRFRGTVLPHGTYVLQVRVLRVRH